jgi:hypothetical protein
MTTKTAAAELITETHRLVTSIEPLFYSLIRTAEHHGLDEVRISTARAREIQNDLFKLKKKLKDSLASETAAITMTTDRHLDSIFNLN